MLRELGLAAAAAPVALGRERLLETESVDAHAVLGRELDRQVDREAERVVQPERDLAGQDRRVVRQVLLAAADHALLARQRDERLLELVRAGIERARELRLLARDRAEDLVGALAQGAGRARPSRSTRRRPSRRGTARAGRAAGRGGPPGG